MRRMAIAAAVLALAGGAALTLVWGQSVEKQAAEGKAPTAEEVWHVLQCSQYTQWAPFPGQPTEFIPTQGAAHGQCRKQYANRIVYANPDQPPYGSILVKDDYTPKKNVFRKVVMVRVKGFDPEHFDWWWAHFDPDGKVVESGKLVKGCAECHSGAKGGDFVFSNDGMQKK